MRKTRGDLMGMPITVEIADSTSDAGAAISAVFDYFQYVDEKFSTYKPASEITAINRGELPRGKWSEDMRLIFELAEKTREETEGYFDITTPNGSYDPSGIVKGWSIWNAAKMLDRKGFKNFYVDAGGDIQTRGANAEGGRWRIGIKNPWNPGENVKVIAASGEGVATSGTYIRGLHIYDPKNGRRPADDIISLTVIGPNIYEADRFATAAFAMGAKGISFIERLGGFEGYAIGHDKTATMTSGFSKFIHTP